MKRKYFSLGMAMIMVMAVLTGCINMKATIDTTKSKKNFTVSAAMYYDKEVIDTMQESNAAEEASGADASINATVNDISLEDIQKLPVVTEDGRQYYVQAIDEDKEPYFKNKLDSPCIVTRDRIYVGNVKEFLNLEESEDLSNAVAQGLMNKFTLEVMFTKKIQKTNGKLSPNKKSVRFDCEFEKIMKGKKKELFAYTVDSENTLSEDRQILKKYEKEKKAKEQAKKKKDK